MAMAACLGLTTAEALNLKCCKTMSVTSDNGGYKKLIKQTGLPTLHEMACLDSLSVTEQIFGIKPNWYTIKKNIRNTRTNPINDDVIDDASNKNKKPIDSVTGVTSECYNTLIHDLFKLKQLYHTDYGPIKAEIKKRKDQVRDKYQKLERKINKSYKNALQELCINRSEELLSIGTPYLERYYLARTFCTVDKKVNYAHLMRTFTLSSRLEFDCLDAYTRIKNRKTPPRKPSKTVGKAPPILSTPVSTRSRTSIQPHTPTILLSTRSKRKNGPGSPNETTKHSKNVETFSRKRKEASKSPCKIAKSPKISKPNAKRSRLLITCDRWVGDKAYCQFCETELVINVNNDGTFCFDSHLLYVCTAIPGLGPLPRNVNMRNRPRDIMRRLAEIGEPPDPGGTSI
jgi:hypothetical protein